MLIVLAIISLAFTLALPNLFSTTKTVGLYSIAFNMKSQFTAARAAAIVRNRPVSIIIDLPKRRYANEAQGGWIRFPDDLTVSVRTARDLTRGEDIRLVFFPDGSSTGGNVFLKRDNHSYNVAVDWLTGQTSVAAVP
jgi:general secretion pathway protein H